MNFNSWSANKIAGVSLIPVIGIWVLIKMGKSFGLKAFLIVFGISFMVSFVNASIDPTLFHSIGFITLLVLPTILQFFIVKRYANDYRMSKTLV